MYPASEHSRYVGRLIDDLRSGQSIAAEIGADLPREVDTVYLGGGTPSLLEPELLRSLFSTIRSEFTLDPDAEITVECAPGQLPDATLAALAECGVNRVSLGVQSFIEREAHESGRLHNRTVVESDLRSLRNAGIGNINLDLIAGLAGQTFSSWEESLSALSDCGAPHASVYMLEVDEDSRLGRELLAGGARYRAALVPNEDAVARMYERAIERLEQAGLVQYEISNFARTADQSRHNLRYWQRKPYLGVGLDASSMLRASDFVLRWTTTDDLRAYLDAIETREVERISIAQQHEEAWFLGLRLNEGVDISALQAEFGDELVNSAINAARRLEADDLLLFRNGKIKLTARGRLLSNNVFQEFLADMDQRDDRFAQAHAVTKA